jgi:ribonuclease VapC
VIVDTSAVIAILFGEPGCDQLADAIAAADDCRMSAANYFEAAIVVDLQAGPSGSRQLDSFFRRSGIVIEPVTVEHAEIARQAYFDFGKGRHPAALNFGDCFAYALARSLGERLLFKGRDFALTDIPPAL